jgi:hypothetical protein
LCTFLYTLQGLVLYNKHVENASIPAEKNTCQLLPHPVVRPACTSRPAAAPFLLHGKPDRQSYNGSKSQGRSSRDCCFLAARNISQGCQKDSNFARFAMILSCHNNRFGCPAWLPWDGIHQIVSRFLERFRYMCPLLFSCVFPS